MKQLVIIAMCLLKTAGMANKAEVQITAVVADAGKGLFITRECKL